MKISQAIIYFISVVLIYLLLILLDLYFIEELLLFLNNHFWLRVAYRLFYMIIIAPIITYFIMERLPFKPETHFQEEEDA